MKKDSLINAGKNVIINLRELAELTSNEYGAQRVAWTPVWQKARNWFANKATSYGAKVTIDAAGNTWAKLTGETVESIIIGSHIDCVPNGGWLDGSLGAVTALEVIKRYSRIRPKKTIYAVNWADEEGARFGRSLMGSSAASGTLDIREIIHRIDNNGYKIGEVLAEYGVNLNTIENAHTQFKKRKGLGFAELHIEQGPILESNKKTIACVYGITGVERYYIKFEGQAAHAGSFPTLLRQDAFLAAAQSALAFREIALKYEGVCTVGKVAIRPDIVTIVPESCIISLDQRSIDKSKLLLMNEEARKAVEIAAKEYSVKAVWEKIWTIDPTIFDSKLVEYCKEAVVEETGERTTIYSGPLHDAAEMSKILPTVMMFVMSERGLSHCKEENTSDDNIETAVRAFMRLVDKIISYGLGNSYTR